MAGKNSARSNSSGEGGSEGESSSSTANRIILEQLMWPAGFSLPWGKKM